MRVYSWDKMIFTSAKVSDDFVYKFIEALEKNKADLVAIQPALREFSAPSRSIRNYDIPVSSGRGEILQRP